MTTAGTTLRFVSWNVKGMGNIIKLQRVMTHLDQLKGDIYFVQETHMLNKYVARLKRRWVGDVFHSTFNGKARGAAILIRKGLPFKLEKSVLDPNGRYVMVSGRLREMPFLFVCVYGPNWDDSLFVSRLFSSFPDIRDHHVVVGGDFNLVQDPLLDRSSNKPAPLTKAAKTLLSLSQHYGLTDPWRHKFSQSKVFSFFSHVHHSYSRIDFFLLDVRLLAKIVSTDYHTIAISDHAPVSIDLALPFRSARIKQWRFNSVLLAEETYREFLHSQLSLFFELNDVQDISRSSLWEASKAYIRGQLISFVSNRKRNETARITQLLKEIKEVDQRYAVDPAPDLYKERLSLQAELDLISTTAVRTALLRSRQSFYESGDKAGKLLSYQARAEASSRLISAIRSDSGVALTDPSDINKTFVEFYTSLYTSDSPPPPDNILDTITFPQISVESAEALGLPITILEVQEAIGSLQSSKSPGPDGFTTEYYKTFSLILSPFLKDMYNEAFSLGRLPGTLSEATISLLLKKDKDPLSCSSYRPISLLNVDFKILTKVLASRLQRVLSPIIDLDQTGFMPNRQSSCNTRRLFNIITTPGTVAPEVVVSLDAEKAFDRVEWGFLYTVLSKFGLGKTFVDWVRLLYSSPRASVRTNDTVSPSFPLCRGTRQGCPLSPLLFVLAIEPLAIWLRSEASFRGITRHNTIHKVSLYADDLLLYVSDPISSFPTILNVLNKYSSISGYKLNYQKSELMPVNALAKSLPTTIVPFRWSCNGFRYLGIQITPFLSDLYRMNLTPLMEKTVADFARWSTLPVSLAGRISLVKMVVLPKFLYMFQHLPIFLNKSFFVKLDKIISAFLWAGKPARIRKSVLQSPKERGGFALPIFRHYYWAANVQKILFWMYDEEDSVPIWVHLEKMSSPFSFRSILCSQLPLPRLHGCPVASISLKVWSQLRKQLGLVGPSALTSVFRNCAFGPSLDTGFKIWYNMGIKSVIDLYTDGVFSSFTQLSDKYHLPSHNFFRFFQARDYVKKVFPHFPNRPPETLLDSLLLVDPTIKGGISIIYKLIWSEISIPPDILKTSWEESLNITITEQQWNSALALVYASSICARHRLIQCKVIYKVHYTNSKLAKIYPSVKDECSRCHLSPADHSHMFWACPNLQQYWAEIFNTLSEAYEFYVAPNPISAIFGVSPSSDLPKALKRAISFTTLLARRLILLNWKVSHSPSHVRWLREVLYNLKIEKLRFSIRGSIKAFHTTWGPFLRYFDSLNFPQNID